jgi:phage terminase large subunit
MLVAPRNTRDPVEMVLTQLMTAMPAPAEERGYPGSYEAFIEQVLRIHLTDVQRTICRSVFEHRRTVAKSCHSSGKTYITAALAIAFLHIHPMSKVITTGPSETHVREVLWQNIRSMAERAGNQLYGAPSVTRWEIAPGWYAIGVKPDEHRAGRIQGHHAPHVLVIADEAAEVPTSILNALESLMTGGGAKMLWLGNPTEVSGPFYEAFHEQVERWNPISITAADTPNIQAGHVVIPGLIDQEYIDEQIDLFGADSDWVRARVYAEFPRNQATSWVQLAHIDRAKRLTEDGQIRACPDYPLDVGVDVARTGDDSNAITFRQGEYVWATKTFDLDDLMASVGRLQSEIKTMKETVTDQLGKPVTVGAVNIDETGIGAGMADRCKELWRDGRFDATRVHGVNFSSGASDREQWPNVRQELWYGLRERFREGRIGGNLSKRFQADVTGAKFAFRSGYTAPLVESKEDMRKRIKRSPDEADSVALSFYISPGARSIDGAAHALSIETETRDRPHYAYEEGGDDDEGSDTDW